MYFKFTKQHNVLSEPSLALKHILVHTQQVFIKSMLNFYEIVPKNATYVSTTGDVTSSCTSNAAGALCTLKTNSPIAPGKDLIVTYTVLVDAAPPVGTTELINQVYFVFVCRIMHHRNW